MEGFTELERASLGASLEGGREGVGVEFGRWGGSHSGVEQESINGHVVADEADDDGVPKDGGWAWNRVEEVESSVGAALAA